MPRPLPISPTGAVSRRRFLLTCAAASLAGGNSLQAASESTDLEMLVDRGPWGQTSLDDLRAVAFTAASEIWRYCPGQRLRPIRIYHRADFPQTDFARDWRGRVRIGLASQDSRWAQIAFQFGHEFCHALAQHSAAARKSWHPPRHSNLWFEDSLCEAASLFVLRRIGSTWQNRPIHPEWRDYAPAFADYATARLARPEHRLPEGTAFNPWFRDSERALRENAALRAKNVIVARQILPLFEADPTGWETACYLNLGQHLESKPLTQYFAEWRTAAPDRQRPFLARLTALFS